MDTKIRVSTLCIEKASQAWCTPETSSIEMNEKLAFAFASILEDIWSKPWLGNATTSEILDELDARNKNAKQFTNKLRKIMDLNYSTVNGIDINYTIPNE